VDLIDARAIASGKRRSTTDEYRAAQAMLAKPDQPCDAQGRPVLFAGSDVCADCGEPYGRAPLISRCAERHHV